MLPHIDDHSIRIAATPERAWDALLRAVHGGFSRPAPRALAALWGLEPASGFAIAEQTAPRHVVLRGRHRFARYALSFDLAPDDGGVVLRARTRAAFPGMAGRAYRALVIGSGGHRFVVRRMLRRIARAAER